MEEKSSARRGAEGPIAGNCQASQRIRLSRSLNAWGTPEFPLILKGELERLDAQVLPLQQGLAGGTQVSEDPFGVMLLNVTEEPTRIRAKVGVCYRGMIAGCSCADDPTPIDGHAEYCEVGVDIDKATAEATFALLPG